MTEIKRRDSVTSAYPEIAQATRIQDTTLAFPLISKVKNLFTFASGAAYGGSYMTTVVSSFTSPGNNSLLDAARYFNLSNNIAASGLSTLSAIKDFLLHPGKIFSKSIAEKLSEMPPEKIVPYLQNRFGLDLEKLQHKALNGKSDADFQNTAILQLRPLVAALIDHLQQLGKIGSETSLTTEKLDLFAETYFGKTELIEFGKELSIEAVRTKKIAKMTQKLGSEPHFKEAIDALSNPKSHEPQARILEMIQQHKRKRNMRVLINVLGTITAILLCIPTAGLSLVALTAINTAVSIGQFGLSYQDTKDLKMKNTAPGRYDKVLPKIGTALAISSIIITLVVANVFGLGLPTLIGCLIGSILWASMNIYQIHCINQQKLNYLGMLLKDRTPLSLQEVDYLHEKLHKKSLQEYGDTLFHRLDASEQKALKRHMKSITVQASEEKLRTAIQLRFTELKAIAAKEVLKSLTSEELAACSIRKL